MQRRSWLVIVLFGAGCGEVIKPQQPDAAPTAMRTLTVAPTGVGTIASDPAGIDCGSTCSASFANGSQVTLSATTMLGTTFMGWAGACTGTDATCTVTMDADVSVNATFVCASGSRTFNYTGAPVVAGQPACVTSVTVDVSGAAGGASYYLAALGGGAMGGRVQGTLAIAQGDVLNVYVGGVGQPSNGTAGGAGGYNGGAAGEIGVSNQTGGGGGGASDIRLNGSALSDRVFIAGGGGGAAACGGQLYDGGLGGGLVGGTAPTLCTTNATAAAGGTQTTGGVGGTFPGYCSATTGTIGAGAPACNPSGGGGAGGGLYGGGGGSWGGGGGGSSFAHASATAVTHSQGVQAGDGVVIISW